MQKITTKNGQEFRLVGERPHTRKDGSPTTLGIWESNCVVCGAAFTVSVPLLASRSDSFGAIHCLEHKLTKAQVKARWLSAARKPR